MPARKPEKQPDPSLRTVKAQVKTLTPEQIAAPATPAPKVKRKASAVPVQSPATPSPKKSRMEVTPTTSRIISAMETLTATYDTTPHAGRPVRTRNPSQKALEAASNAPASKKKSLTRVTTTRAVGDSDAIVKLESGLSDAVIPNTLDASSGPVLLASSPIEISSDDEDDDMPPVSQLFKSSDRDLFLDMEALKGSTASEASPLEDAGDESDGLGDFIVPDSDGLEDQDSNASLTDDDAHSAASNAARLKAKFRREAPSKESSPASEVYVEDPGTPATPTTTPHGEANTVPLNPPVMRPDIQDPLMAATYQGLPHLHKCLKIVSHSYDATIDDGRIGYSSVSQIAPVLPAADAKSLRNALTFVTHGNYVNFARVQPTNLWVTKYNKVALRNQGAFCVGLMSGVITDSHLFDSGVVIESGRSSYRQHRVSMTPFHQEELHELALLGVVLDLPDGTRANVSHQGLAFVSRGEGKAIRFNNRQGYAVPATPAVPVASDSPFITMTQERREPVLNVNDPYKSVIDYESIVPVYDGRSSTGDPFQFTPQNLDKLLSWRSFEGNRTEIPKNSVVVVGYSPSRYGGNKEAKDGRSSGETFLTLNVLFVVVLYVPTYEVGLGTMLPPGGPSSAKKSKDKKGKAKLLLAASLDELETREPAMTVAREDIFAVFRASMLSGNLGGIAKNSILDAKLRLLMSYRVLDVQCLLEGVHLRPTKASGSVQYHPKLFLNELNDVRNIVSSSTSALAAHFKRLKTKARELKSSTPATMKEPTTGPLIGLYANLAGRMQKHGVNQSLMNIMSATLHLACLLKGLMRRETETLDSAELLRLRSSQIGGGKVAHHHLQNTLFLALIASPLLILLPRSFTELSGKEALLKTWADIGCLERPPAVLKAERDVWGVLYAAARGANLLSELATVMENLGDEFLEAAPAWLCVEGQPDSKVNDDSAVARQPFTSVPGPPPRFTSPQMEHCMHTFGISTKLVSQQGPTSIVSPSLLMLSERPNSGRLSGMLTPPDERCPPSQVTAGTLPLHSIPLATSPTPSSSTLLHEELARPLSLAHEEHVPAGPPSSPSLSALGSMMKSPLIVPTLPSSTPAVGPSETPLCASTTNALPNFVPSPHAILPLGTTSTQCHVPGCEHPCTIDCMLSPPVTVPSVPLSPQDSISLPPVPENLLASAHFPSAKQIDGPTRVDASPSSPFLILPPNTTGSPCDSNSRVDVPFEFGPSQENQDPDCGNPSSADHLASPPVRPLQAPLSPRPCASASPGLNIPSTLSRPPLSVQNEGLACGDAPLPPLEPPGCDLSPMSSAPSSPPHPILPCPSPEPPCTPSPPTSPPTVLGKRETRSSGREKSSDEKPNYKEGKAPPKKPKRKPKAQQIKPEDAPWKVPRDPDTGGPIVLIVEDSDPENSDTELDLEEQPMYYTGSRMVRYPVYGTRHDLEWTPAFHRNEDLEWFYELDKATIDGSKCISYVKIIRHKDFICTDARTLLDFFKTHACIMVIDGPKKNEQFTLEALSRVGPLDEPVTLHDFTFPTSDRHRSGTLLDLYRCATGRPDKSVSCLDLPSTMDYFAELPFASDIAAWAEVQGRAYHRSWELYPVSDMRWFLAATDSAYHYWHMDSNGLGTTVRVDVGIKIWYIGVPRNGDFRSLHNMESYVNGFYVNSANTHLWNVVPLVLIPGTTLYMRPGLPHAVVTPHASICSGGHFVPATTLEESVVAVYHHFTCGNTITNTTHAFAAHSLFMRLLTLFTRKLCSDRSPEIPVDLTHVPDLATWDGCLGIIFLCVYFELHSAIYEWRYDNPEEDQRRFEASIKSRTRARRLMYWFFSTHSLGGPVGAPGADALGILTGKDALNHVYVTLLARHARLLVRYKKYAWANDVFGERPDLRPEDVEFFVNACIREGPAETLYASMDDDTKLSSFSWHGPAYVVRPVEPVAFDFPFLSGHVFGDCVTARHRGIVLQLDPVGVLLCDDPKYDVILYRPPETKGEATVDEAAEHDTSSGSEDEEHSEFEESGSAPTPVRKPARKCVRRE
ncbi:hypothetical protein DXG01_014410 [Tephrocybe rancida]|nr:hypothetical protein DXG01_014410 [Tephrocybe rancida]